MSQEDQTQQEDTTTQSQSSTASSDNTAAVTPVTIGTVTVTEAITPTDILKQQGIIEAVLPDGTRKQFSVEQAQELVNTQQAVVEALGGRQ